MRQLFELATMSKFFKKIASSLEYLPRQLYEDIDHFWLKCAVIFNSPDQQFLPENVWFLMIIFELIKHHSKMFQEIELDCWIRFSHEITHFSLLQTILRHKCISFWNWRHDITLVNTPVHLDFQSSGFLFRGRWVLQLFQDQLHLSL